MTYGYLQINTDGFTQIDDTYSNYILVASGTGTANNSNVVTFPTQTVIPLIAVGSISTGGRVTLTALSTSQFRLSYAPNGAANPTFAYKVYAPIETVTVGGYGLQVFNASGTAVFDSNQNYFRTRAITLVNPSTDFPTTINATLPVYTFTHSLGGTPYTFLNTMYQTTTYVGNGSQLFDLCPFISMPDNNSIVLYESTRNVVNVVYGATSRRNFNFRLIVGL